MQHGWLRGGALLASLPLASLASAALGGWAWLLVGVLFAAVFARGAPAYLSLGLGLTLALRLGGASWSASVFIALLGALCTYLCALAMQRYAPNEPSAPSVRGVLVSLACALVLLALPLALMRGLLVSPWLDASSLGNASARIARSADGLALSLNLAHAPVASALQALWGHVQQAMLGLLLLAPAAWVVAARSPALRRSFAWALAAQLAAFCWLAWSAAHGAWPFAASSSALPLCAAAISLLCTVLAASRTERAQLQQHMQRADTLDALTALPTRQILLRELEAALAHARRERDALAVLYIDLDGCKRVNDSLSHDLGDSLLIEGARRLERNLAARARLFRLGGDEFAVMLEAAGQLETPEQVAARLIEATRAPFVLDGHELALSCCIGISQFPRDADNAPELIKLASAALAAAKRDGANIHRIYEPGLSAHTHAQQQLDEELRRACTRAELSLLYRPQASVRSGKLLGLEAVPCLQRADGSVVAGGALLESAQRSGLTAAFTAHTIQRVCAQLAFWQQSGHTLLPVTVPVSLRQVPAQAVQEALERALPGHNLPAESIGLDLIDFPAGDHQRAGVRAALHTLDALGVRLRADFEQTSWAQLARWPLRALALSPALLEELEEPRAQNVVRNLMQGARTLQCDVVARGVTTATQLETLRSLGVDHYDGDLLSTPVPAHEVERLRALEQHRLAFIASVSHYPLVDLVGAAV